MSFIDQPTETALNSWRFGDTQAERLCATLLHSEGFKRVDPQSPLGGPDGLKDVLFELNGWRYVAACYFPPTVKKFKDVKKKFKNDFEGVAKNVARGIAFFTNQHLTPSESKSLEKVASDASSTARIYHIEAIRAIVDSPRGYGMRLEYLRIPMKPEEQVSFISQFGSDLSAAMNRNSDEIASIAKKVSEIHAAILSSSGQHGLHYVSGVKAAVLGGSRKQELNYSRLAATIATRAIISEMFEASDKTNIKAKTAFITQHLDTELLCYLHRSMLDDEPGANQSGRLRAVGVWIGTPGSTPEHARYVPPKPEEVGDLVNALLRKWRDNYEKTMRGDQPEKIDQIMQFHHEFLKIHPFLDGNGRLARLIMEQQARELLNIERRVVLEDSAAYFEALQKAHDGDMEPLRIIITQVLLGSLTTEG